MQPRVLVITPVDHIKGVNEILESFADVTYLEDPSQEEVLNLIEAYDSIFTNPNKSKVFLGADLLTKGKSLKVICTASTGTNHIDKEYAAKQKLPIISLTEERHIINRISSTAELAFALTMTSLRNVVQSHKEAMKGEWDYMNYIGRQINCLTVGVIGYGRLGKMYSEYCKAFGARVLVYDPYKRIKGSKIQQVESLDILLKNSDVISLHVHVTEETENMLNKNLFSKMKEDVLIVNTSRGDIIKENDLVNFLSFNPNANIAADVIADEQRNRLDSPLLKFARKSDQVILTQHIGGMTREAQEIAYSHAATLLKDFFSQD